MALDFLFGQVKDAVFNHHAENQQQGGGMDPSGLMNTLGGLFGQHAANTGQDFGNVTSSNSDPYGDPGNQQYGNVRSSNQDPYGDPG